MKHASFFSNTSLATAFSALFLLGACTASVAPGAGSGTDLTGTTASLDTASASSSFMTVSDLVAQLNAEGNTAALGTNRVQQPFFSGNGQEIQVNGQTVQVFQYQDQQSAETDADKISDDGMSVGGTAVNWSGPPHFFQADNLLVLYVGSDPSLINTLESTLGIQFAGASDTTEANTGTGSTMSTDMSGTNLNTSY